MKFFNLKNIILIVSLISNIFFTVHFYIDLTTSSSDLYPLLSPRIFVENQNDIIINFIALRKQIKEYVDNISHKEAIYFEYLPSGVSIGINEKEEFTLASLLKVPLVMGVYKQIERGNLSKDNILTIQKDDIDPAFGDLWKKGVGYKITVEKAIRLTLTESDNTAKSVLYNNMPPGMIEEVFNFLDIPMIRENNETSVVTAKNYSSILRSLYLSSYLNKKNSNEILNILTETIFTDKLPAGFSGKVKIAHKIGVFDKDNPLKSIFTDCGIIYVPKRPYILCIMTQTDEEMARDDMRHISKLVYDYVLKYNKNDSSP